MKRLSRATIAAIFILQAIFWLALALWLNLRPQVTQNPQQTERATGAGNIIAVEMNNKLRFAPTEITIKAGDTVEWRNIGSAQHFLNIHSAAYNTFYCQRHLNRRSYYKELRTASFDAWKTASAAA